jgi:hypothetical protein
MMDRTFLRNSSSVTDYVFPVTRLITSCLETHARHMRVRAERSIAETNRAPAS